MDYKLHVACLSTSRKSLHGWDFDAALELLLLYVAKLVSSKQEVALLLHTKPVVLEYLGTVDNVL